MNTVIERINKAQFWQFHGGIHPPEQKFLTNDKPIRPLPIPEKLIIPVQQHIGEAGNLIVAVGDKVLKGQPLTEPASPMSVTVHAPTSGTITAIKNATIAHPSAMQELCVEIASDGLDKWREREICEDFIHLSREEIITKIANGGIAGMGGAGFPTHFKVNTKPVIDYLIINAAECEPYITADDLLIREHSSDILDGIKILDHLLLPEYILIGIEDNKPEAIKALQKASQGYEKIKICVVPTKYPTGGEKQLIKVLTGKEIPSGSIPVKHGIIMQNIATCYAIADAVINDTPLIRRVVTVTGQALDKPQNVWAKIGTPVQFLLDKCGYQKYNNDQLIMGGPMMGFALPNTQVPVVKITNCLLVPSKQEITTNNKEIECIRCGQCADVCPSQLLPQELQWSAKAKDYEQLKKLNLFDCIDCGACAYVCPSHIPLVQYYRVAKAEIRQQQLLEVKAEKAKARFEARKQRLEREKRAREEKHRLAAEARRAKMNAKSPEAQEAKSAVAAALARVKAKKAQQTDDGTADNHVVNADVSQSTATEQTSQKSAVAAAVARAKAKKLAAQAKAEKPTATVSETAIEQTAQTAAESKSQAVDKVTKAHSNKTQSPQKETNTDKPADKKAQIAAAVAKAKAKKLAEKKAQQQNITATAEPETQTNTEQSKQNEKSTINVAKDEQFNAKAQVANSQAQTAIDEAKTSTSESAERSANSNKETKEEPPPSTTRANADTDKAARVKQAIAKAKAKKLAAEKTTQTAQNLDNSSTSQMHNLDDEKKKRIAEAIAKAKAKKLQAESK